MDVHLFPGQGSQYTGMTSGLRGDPWVSEMTDRAEARAYQLLGCRFGDYFRSGTSPDQDVVQSFLCDQLRIFLGSLSIHHRLSLRDVTAAWRIGHSLGEISALTAAGWFDVDTALMIVCLRSKAIVDSAPPGGMTAVFAPAERVMELLGTTLDHSLSLSTFNSPSQATVSGLTKDLDQFEKHLEKNGMTYKRLHAKYPFHGPFMANAAKAFNHSIAGIGKNHGDQVWSSIYNRPYTPHDQFDQLLSSHLVLPVLFCQSLTHFAQVGVNNYVEIGGRKALVGLTRDLLKTLGRTLPRFVTTSLPGGESEDVQIDKAAVKLVTPLNFYVLSSPPSPNQPPSTPMISLSSCSNDELQALIIAATGELSRRAQAMGSIHSMQSIPISWSQQAGVSGWQSAQGVPSWSTPHPPMGWIPAGPGVPQGSIAAPPIPPTVRQEPGGLPSPLPSPQAMSTGNDHAAWAQIPTPQADAIPAAPPSSIENQRGPALSSANTPSLQALQPQTSQLLPTALPKASLGQVATAATPGVDHGDPLLNQLILVYQEATEYPAEILEPDANLEADLGIDSVKQMQVLGLVREKFSFELPDDIDMKAMRTIREVAESIRPLAKIR